MRTEEANKIIAEFMGRDVEFCANCAITDYSDSLDALVPVWEKLDIERVQHVTHISSPVMSGDTNICFLKPWRKISVEGYGLTIQGAACIATVRAIQELEK